MSAFKSDRNGKLVYTLKYLIILNVDGKRTKKLKLKRLAVLTLLFATIVYALALCRQMQTYEEWKQSEIQRYAREHGYTVEFWANLLDFRPFYETSTARLFIYIGCALGLSWLTFFAVTKRNAILVYFIIAVLIYAGVASILSVVLNSVGVYFDS
jgi:hypothetical protein